MSGHLEIMTIAPGASVQDLGRPGHLRLGLAKCGAADPLAHVEGATLLGQSTAAASLEMAGTGGTFRVTNDSRIALTGAPMRADIDGAPLVWNASHLLRAGEVLTIGGASEGVYGYLHLGGGLETPATLGARSTHFTAGLGHPVHAGDQLPMGPDGGEITAQFLPADPRFSGGDVRVVQSLQTELFPPEDLQRFEQSVFTRDPRGNRMGVKLLPDGRGFQPPEGLRILSEIIAPGDIQMTGDGSPYVLLSECQTTGGYPRIGQVLPSDLPRVAQAPPGARIRFRFIERTDALHAERQEAARRAGLASKLLPLVRDPSKMRDLLSYQLISGVIRGEP